MTIADSIPLLSIVRYCDEKLCVKSFKDWDGAMNGLQMENSGQVTRIAAGVDATLATCRLAVNNQADLLIVHHGLFWGNPIPWVGKKYELIKFLVESNLAVYSAHLPLDAHSSLGNNILLFKALGLKDPVPFFECKGREIGFKSVTMLSRSTLLSRLTKLFGPSVKMLPAGREECRFVGIVTGGAGADLQVVAAAGVDTFITGEGPHWTFGLAEELGINVFYCGHYATETFGVKALAKHLSKKFNLPWSFVDHPSGL